MKLIQCARCGGELKEENGRYVCAYCHATYEDDTLERAYAELKNSLESVVGTELNEVAVRERERSLANLRKELWKEIHEKYVNSKKITGICREIKKISPDDFSANFYELMNDESDESRRVCEFLNTIDEKKYFDYVEDVVDFVVKSLKVEYLTSLNGLVERAYKNDLQTFSKIMTKIETEAEKVENGLYVLEKPRDVFVAYSSKDIAVVNELVACLEEQGIECFVAMRNLQHGAKSVENYEKALETAMDNCKVFVFVSSKNSRSLACDAMKREIPYIKKKDLEFKPEYRNDYDKMPEKYRKPRIQYRIDDVKTMAVDRQIKEFFGTLQWRCDLDSVVEQVGEYLSREVEEPTQAPVNEEKLYEQFKKRMQEEESARKAEQARIAEEQRKAEEARKATADFEIVNGVLIKYKGKGGDVVIPNGVTEIGKSAFQECKNLTSVVIPNGVAKIADRAFGWCDNLKTVQIPSSVKSIGERSFTTCKSLESITIPDGVVSLGDYAFDWCESLKTVEMADSVTKMGVAVFSVCKKLEKVKLSKNLTRIENESFPFCENLKEIEIPEKVNYIGDKAFTKCTNLEQIVIPKNVLTIGKEAFGWCDNLKTVQIPSSVKSIGERSFTTCKSLESITIPDGVVSLGDYAFDWCESLKTVEMADSVTKMGVAVFSVCKKLEKVKLSKNLTRIENESFPFCESLKEIEIPEKVNYIGDKAFMKCTNLERIMISKNVLTIGKEAFGWCDKLKIFANANEKPSGWNAEWNNTNCHVVWGYKAGAGTSATPKTEEVKNVEKKEIPPLRKTRSPISGLASFLNKIDFEIENGVLKKYKGKGGDVVIPSEVKEIGDRAFYNCENVTSVVIPHGVTCIGRSLLGGGGVFNGCKNLKSVVIPSSVTNIEYGSFDNCPNLTIYAEITDKPTGWIKDIKWQQYWNYSCPVVWGYKIGNSTDDFEVENTTFKTVLKKYKGKGGDVVIPDGVTDIAENAFANCDKVTSVAFSKTANFLTRTTTSSGEVSPINIERRVFSIGANAFSGCSGLKSIVIPKSVTDIAKNTFKDCPNLTIYAETQNKPENWVNGMFTGRWNPDKRPVVWGQKGQK